MKRRKKIPLILAGAPGITYIINDTFTTNRAAGSVDGTAAEPGPGTRNVLADSTNMISISSGSKVWSSAATPSNYSDPEMIYDETVARAAGLMFKTKYLYGANTNRKPTVGIWDGGHSRYSIHGIEHLNGNLAIKDTSSVSAFVDTYTTNTEYEYAVIARASGYQFFRKEGSDWALLYTTKAGMDSPLGIQFLSAGVPEVSYRYVILAQTQVLASPIVSDGFGSTFGTTDGLGHLEPSGLGAGGNGATWTAQAGTWATSSGSASAATLSSGVAIATVSDAHADAQITASLTRSTGEIGIVSRLTDTSNYLRAFHDGTNCVLEQIVSGTPSTLITLTATYSAGAEIRLITNGTNARLFYNDSLIGSTASINAALIAGVHGLYADNTTDSLDDFTIYNRGASGEYEAIDAV